MSSNRVYQARGVNMSSGCCMANHIVSRSRSACRWCVTSGHWAKAEATIDPAEVAEITDGCIAQRSYR